jgi:hypothetical protein
MNKDTWNVLMCVTITIWSLAAVTYAVVGNWQASIASFNTVVIALAYRSLLLRYLREQKE